MSRKHQFYQHADGIPLILVWEDRNRCYDTMRYASFSIIQRCEDSEDFRFEIGDFLTVALFSEMEECEDESLVV